MSAFIAMFLARSELTDLGHGLDDAIDLRCRFANGHEDQWLGDLDVAGELGDGRVYGRARDDSDCARKLRHRLGDLSGVHQGACVLCQITSLEELAFHHAAQAVSRLGGYNDDRLIRSADLSPVPDLASQYIGQLSGRHPRYLVARMDRKG